MDRYRGISGLFLQLISYPRRRKRIVFDARLCESESFSYSPTQEEVDAITFVEARPVVRIGLSRERLLELIGMLEIHLRNTNPQSEN